LGDLVVAPAHERVGKYFVAAAVVLLAVVLVEKWFAFDICVIYNGICVINIGICVINCGICMINGGFVSIGIIDNLRIFIVLIVDMAIVITIFTIEKTFVLIGESFIVIIFIVNKSNIIDEHSTIPTFISNNTTVTVPVVIFEVVVSIDRVRSVGYSVVVVERHHIRVVGVWGPDPAGEEVGGEGRGGVGLLFESASLHGHGQSRPVFEGVGGGGGLVDLHESGGVHSKAAVPATDDFGSGALRSDPMRSVGQARIMVRILTKVRMKVRFRIKNAFRVIGKVPWVVRVTIKGFAGGFGLRMIFHWLINSVVIWSVFTSRIWLIRTISFIAIIRECCRRFFFQFTRGFNIRHSVCSVWQSGRFCGYFGVPVGEVVAGGVSEGLPFHPSGVCPVELQGGGGAGLAAGELVDGCEPEEMAGRGFDADAPHTGAGLAGPHRPLIQHDCEGRHRQSQTVILLHLRLEGFQGF